MSIEDGYNLTYLLTWGDFMKYIVVPYVFCLGVWWIGEMRKLAKED